MGKLDLRPLKPDPACANAAMALERFRSRRLVLRHAGVATAGGETATLFRCLALMWLL